MRDCPKRLRTLTLGQDTRIRQSASQEQAWRELSRARANFPRVISGVQQTRVLDEDERFRLAQVILIRAGMDAGSKPTSEWNPQTLSHIDNVSPVGCSPASSVSRHGTQRRPKPRNPTPRCQAALALQSIIDSNYLGGGRVPLREGERGVVLAAVGVNTTGMGQYQVEHARVNAVRHDPVPASRSAIDI